MTVATHWANRIVGYSEEPPDQLLASPWNWRIHSHAQENALAGVLHEVGLVQNIICNRTTGHVIDGHLRVGLALSEGQPTVPVTWVELTEDEERLVLATLDPLASMAATDAVKLEELLHEVQSAEPAVQAMLAELAGQTPFGLTSTEREGQGVASTWDQVGQTDNQKVVIGEIETRLPADVVQLLADALNRAYEENRAPIYETLEAIIVAGVRAVETGSD